MTSTSLEDDFEERERKALSTPVASSKRGGGLSARRTETITPQKSAEKHVSPVSSTGEIQRKAPSPYSTGTSN